MPLAATGLVVCPGFIDLHTHCDTGSPKIDTARGRPNKNYVTQGVTTVVTGNCGAGPVDTAKFFASLEAGGVGTNQCSVFRGRLRVREEDRNIIHLDGDGRGFEWSDVNWTCIGATSILNDGIHRPGVDRIWTRIFLVGSTGDERARREGDAQHTQ